MFEELLASLDEAGVRFVVVGGLAVVIQGFARLTADVDLVIDLDRENVSGPSTPSRPAACVPSSR